MIIEFELCVVPRVKTQKKKLKKKRFNHTLCGIQGRFLHVCVYVVTIHNNLL